MCFEHIILSSCDRSCLHVTCGRCKDMRVEDNLCPVAPNGMYLDERRSCALLSSSGNGCLSVCLSGLPCNCPCSLCQFVTCHMQIWILLGHYPLHRSRNKLQLLCLSKPSLSVYTFGCAPCNSDLPCVALGLSRSPVQFRIPCIICLSMHLSEPWLQQGVAMCRSGHCQGLSP